MMENDTENRTEKDEDSIQTAQSILEYVMENTDFTQTQTLTLSSIMHGTLDFSVIKDRKVTVTTIVFEAPGGVTDMLNLPEGVKHLHCPHQKIAASIQQLPASLETLDLSHNELTSFDGTPLESLTDLSLQNNELARLTNLPSSLLHLNVENNRLKELSLAKTPKLQSLKCSNNPILVLQHVPPSLTNIVMENNPFLEIEHATAIATTTSSGQSSSSSSSSKKVEYLASLHEYFRLKSQYESKVMELKRKAFYKGGTKKEGRKLVAQVTPPCIACKRNVGTHFKQKDGSYHARCGDTNQPCKLKVHLFSGDNYRLEQMMEIYDVETQSEKEKIIVQKMDSLFKYVNDETSTKEFEQMLKDFHMLNESYESVKQTHEHVHNNVETSNMLAKKTAEKYAIISAIQQMIQEYKKTSNRDVLLAIAQEYKKELLPLNEQLRRLQYPHMFVEFHDDEGNKKPPISILKQMTASVYDRNYVYGDKATVVEFMTDA